MQQPSYFQQEQMTIPVSTAAWMTTSPLLTANNVAGVVASDEAHNRPPPARKDSYTSSTGSYGGGGCESESEGGTPSAHHQSNNNSNNQHYPKNQMNHSSSNTSKPDPYSSKEYLEAMDDVHTRFLLNLPDSELETADRIFFQIEQAWWFYEDCICDALALDNNNNNNSETPAGNNNNSGSNHNLPRFSSLKPFAAQMFRFSPLLDESSFAEQWMAFSQYKRQISNYGCILLNSDATKFVLCQLYKSNTHTFPAGKINQGETGAVAAARETYEETGFDPHCQFGLTALWKEQDPSKITWYQNHDIHNNNNNNRKRQSSKKKRQSKGSDNDEEQQPLYQLSERDALVVQEEVEGGKRRTCYVCHGVPEDFPFAPTVRKEIAHVAWHSIDNVPKRSFAVLPFLSQLRRWIRKNVTNKNSSTQQSSDFLTPGRNSHNKQQRNKSNPRDSDSSNPRATAAAAASDGAGGGKRSTSRKKSTGRAGSASNTPKRSRSTTTSSRGRVVRDNDDLVHAGLARAGEAAGWSEEDMFRTNELLIGRKIEYDGNPHIFAEQGFGGKQDPHAFHVVGGTFLNAAATTTTPAGTSSLASGGSAAIAGLWNATVADGIVSVKAPEQSRLQPLFCRSSEEDELQPFFSDDGATPWGLVVEEAAGSNDHNDTTSSESPRHRTMRTTPGPNNPNNKKRVSSDPNKNVNNNNKGAGESVMDFLQSCARREQDNATATAATTTTANNENGTAMDNIFLTDAEITAKSQAEKLKRLSEATRNEQKQQAGDTTTATTTMTTSTGSEQQRRQARRLQYEQDLEYIRQWVANLPKAKPTKFFGEFKLDAEQIMATAALHVQQQQQQQQKLVLSSPAAPAAAT